MDFPARTVDRLSPEQPQHDAAPGGSMLAAVYRAAGYPSPAAAPTIVNQQDELGLAAVHRAAGRPTLSEVIQSAFRGEPQTAPQQPGSKDMSINKSNRGGTDQEAVAFAAQSTMNESALNELWRERYTGSLAIRDQFVDAKDYAAFMTAQVRKARKQNPLPAGERRGIATLEPHEQAAVDRAKQLNLPTDAMTAQWHASWKASDALQDEFPDKETYAAFMNACVGGRVRIFRR